jgi:4-hydroxybenzoyl-CoA thioesterase/acyl-CoA thioester hydrolase
VREFRLRRRVQFYETDAAGIVHFTWFFRYMEEAEHALWREAGLSIHPRDSPIGWPRVATAFDFHRPLRFEDEFDVTIRVTSINRRTITYECLMAKGDERVATGTLTISCVEKRPSGPLRSIDIPDDVRARLS